jgi:hypothetical protein
MGSSDRWRDGGKPFKVLAVYVTAAGEPPETGRSRIRTFWRQNALFVLDEVLAGSLGGLPAF